MCILISWKIINHWRCRIIPICLFCKIIIADLMLFLSNLSKLTRKHTSAKVIECILRLLIIIRFLPLTSSSIHEPITEHLVRECSTTLARLFLSTTFAIPQPQRENSWHWSTEKVIDITSFLAIAGDEGPRIADPVRRHGISGQVLLTAVNHRFLKDMLN